MPKSKRAKVVHLTQVDKKDKAHRQKLYTEIQTAIEAYPTILIFSVENMRNTYLKEVRTQFSDSRLFYAKTKIMAKALGTDAASEHLPGLAHLSKHVKGDVGMLCTPRPVEEVLSYFEEYSQTDYARAGVEAAYTFTIPAGIVYSLGGAVPASEDVPLPHSVETILRKWGMPTRLDKGKIMLNEEYTVCKEGETMNSNQTALLKIFGVAMAEFRIRPVAYWQSETGAVTVVNAPMEE
ncbi:mRNA turnover protein-like protein 4 [Tothia fuscella]|uniref:Ribosome assembly factor mrt4 n=1 Tax=Tothia fuscella TaxID=1048955 RepID=A0A9P4NQQ9_9PEZI|nr:mRNA turnover protein-like protein 4 [Tothia fuscella]